jgi:glycosyltransferase involved in cell wall biosynthesis
MPVRDGEKWLAPALDSVLRQTLADFELIIVDDGSADATPAILAEYGHRDPRVRTIRMDRTGLVAALNRGLSAAAAPLIARLDADDVCMPHRLERQARVLDENPSVVMVGSWAEVIDATGRPIGRMERPTAHPELARLLDQGNPFIHSSVMFRTDVVRDLGGYRSAFAAAEDYDLLVRIAERGEVMNLPESLVQYRRHQGSVTQTQAVRQVFSVRMARRAREFRATGAADPAGGLIAPPDFFAPEAETAFYAEDAQLCRILALGDACLLSTASLARISMDALRHNLPQMSRVERKLAQTAIIAILKSKISPLPEARMSMLALLFRLNAGKALTLLPSLLGGGKTRERESAGKNSSRE